MSFDSKLQLIFQMGRYTKNYHRLKKGLNPHGGKTKGSGSMKPTVTRASDNVAVGVLRLPSPERRAYFARAQRRRREREMMLPPPKKSKEEEDSNRTLRLAGRILEKLTIKEDESHPVAGPKGDAAPAQDGEEQEDDPQTDGEQEDDPQTDGEREEFSDTDLEYEHKDREDGAGAVSPTLEEAPEAVEVEEQEELPSPLLDKEELLRLFLTYQEDQSPERQKNINNLLEPIFDRTRLGGKAFKLGVVYHSNVELHGDQREGRCFGGEELGAQHESPQRTKAIFDLLLAEGIIAEADFISEAREATDEEIMAVHTANHLANLKKLEKMSYKERDLWCARNDSKTLFANSGTTKAALTSAGGVLLGIDHVLRVGGDQ